MTTQENKFNLSIGTKIDIYYGDGKFCCTSQVTKMNDKSCYIGENRRESWNTVNNGIKKGFYVIR